MAIKAENKAKTNETMEVGNMENKGLYEQFIERAMEDGLSENAAKRAFNELYGPTDEEVAIIEQIQHLKTMEKNLKIMELYKAFDSSNKTLDLMFENFDYLAAKLESELAQLKTDVNQIENAMNNIRQSLDSYHKDFEIYRQIDKDFQNEIDLICRGEVKNEMD